MATKVSHKGELPPDVLREMEALNGEAGRFHIWLRTQPNSPVQRPWHLAAPAGRPPVAPGAVIPSHPRAVAHVWHWKDIAPYLYRVAELCPLEFTERQQFLLVNPGLPTGIKVTNTIRVAVSIYRPGDVAETHLHTPNASRTILSAGGGYTIVEGERFAAERGDLLLTPNGTWHGHGNDGAEPIIWMDVLDWPLLDYLDVIWIRSDYASARPNEAPAPAGWSQKLYGQGGVVPRSVPPTRGTGIAVSPMFQYRGRATRAALDAMRDQDGSAYEGVEVEFVNPVDGTPVFPTLAYKAQLLRPAEATRPFRHTASAMYVVLEGTGYTEVDGVRLDWGPNDFFVIPNHQWRSHVNADAHKDAVLYQVTDAPLLRAIGQYRAQGRGRDGAVVDLA
ncbi:MAG: cupin domain-containing protein [Alphaproteobacteria bacterium]|nr:cupin domain-containing protein [Alphaproteobacteria bacterium]